MQAFGEKATHDARIYLVGGATAVMYAWRESTVDVDVRFAGDEDELLREIPAIKEALSINVETASPDQFIPVRDGWEERSRFVSQYGRLSVYHFDLYAQALAKIERGHRQDLEDVRAMVRLGLVRLERLRDEYEQIEPLLYRYPSLDPTSFRKAVEAFIATETDG